jgi:hypothetical protein
MKSTARIGAVLVATLALWASPAWAALSRGNSDQWIYVEWDVGWAMGGQWVEYVPCLGEGVRISGVFRLLVNEHTTPSGYKTYTRHFVQQDGDIVLEGLSSGNQYFLRGGMCWNENAHGPWDLGGSYGTDTGHLVFVAENGDRVVLNTVMVWSMMPILEMKHIIWNWSCK